MAQSQLSQRLAESSRGRTGDECWPWAGYIDAGGYGRLGVGWAHRLTYELEVGPIPPGWQVDHLCRRRDCVNPAHLEAVTQGENLRRQADAVTRCRRGHEFTDENTYRSKSGRRTCRACRLASNRRWRQNQRGCD